MIFTARKTIYICAPKNRGAYPDSNRDGSEQSDTNLWVLKLRTMD